MKYLIMLGLFLLAACTAAVDDSVNEPIQEGTESSKQMKEDQMENINPEDMTKNDLNKEMTKDMKDSEMTKESWLDIELVNVNDDTTYKLSDFKGQKILVESFAVWCPKCKSQQEILSDVEGAVHVAINTDPNEDAAKVREHTSAHGFDWHFSVAPERLTRELIEEFGLGIVNAPSVPMILICEDQTYRLLDTGIKQKAELEEELERGCNA